MKTDKETASKPVKNKLNKHLARLAETEAERTDLGDYFLAVAGQVRANLASTAVQKRFANALLIAASAMATPEQLARKGGQ